MEAVSHIIDLRPVDVAGLFLQQNCRDVPLARWVSYQILT